MDVIDDRLNGWLAEHPPAHAALERVMGDEVMRIALTLGAAAAVFAPSFGGEAPTSGVIVIATTPNPTLIRGDGTVVEVSD